MNGPPRRTETGGPAPAWSAEDFEPIAAILRRQVGTEFSKHRLELIRARLQVRLRALGVMSFTGYSREIVAGGPNSPGMQLLIDHSTVNHSRFFREAPTLRRLAEQLATRLRAVPAAPVRVWSAGCSAGQEPYSLAISIAELMPGGVPDRLEIWASDLSMEMIHRAVRAIFDGRELADLPPDQLRRYFLRGRRGRHGAYRVAPEVRALVKFLHFDLRRADWPIPEQLDAILCRNVALYFTEAERPVLLDRLAGVLRPGGWLAVGNCEILPERPGLLEKQSQAIYRKVATS